MNETTPVCIDGREAAVLRPLGPQDVDVVAELFADPEVTAFTRIGSLTRAQAAGLLDDWLQPTGDRYWAVHRDDGVAAGLVFLRSVDATHRSAELGYALARASWGRGLATAMVAAAVQHAWENLGLCRVEAYVSPDNIASLRVLEKNGFEREGLRRADVYRSGRFQDSVLLSRLNEPLIRELTQG